MATRLAADGVKIIVNYSRSAEDANVIVNKIIAAGGQATAFKAGISKPEEIAPLIHSAVSTFGRLDILVNNAGIYKSDSLDSLTAESTDEHSTSTYGVFCSPHKRPPE